MLTRETTLLLAFALAAAWMIERIARKERRIAAITFAIPIAVYALWQLFLALRWGVTPLHAGAPDRALPFVEFARFLAVSSFRRYHQQRLYFTESLFLAAVVITVILIWRRTRATIEWRLAWLGYLAIFSILPHTIWLEDYGFLRIFADLFLVSAALIIPSNAPARWFTLLTAASLWYYLAKHIVLALVRQGGAGTGTMGARNGSNLRRPSSLPLPVLLFQRVQLGHGLAEDVTTLWTSLPYSFSSASQSDME